MVECTLSPKVFHTWFAPKPAKVVKPKPAPKPVVKKEEKVVEPVEPPKPVKPTPPKPAPFGSKII